MNYLTHDEQCELLYKALAYIANIELTDDFKDFLKEHSGAASPELAAEMLAWELYNAV